MPYRFLKRPPACDILQQALLLRLLLIELQNPKQRCSDEGEDDCERSITPSPVRVIETLGSFGTSESRDHVGRRGVGVGKSSVSEGRGVSGDDVDGEDKTGKADGSEDL